MHHISFLYIPHYEWPCSPLTLLEFYMISDLSTHSDATPDDISHVDKKQSNDIR